MSSVAPVDARDADDPAAGLVAEVRDRSRSVIETELQRLSRRVPSLSTADLDVVEAALEDLADSLLLHRLRTAPRDTAPLLRRLFDAATGDR